MTAAKHIPTEHAIQIHWTQRSKTTKQMLSLFYFGPDTYRYVCQNSHTSATLLFMLSVVVSVCGRVCAMCAQKI